jgi:hypothetical protein
MTTRRAKTNAEALDRALRRLRRAGRLDEMSEVVATLAGTSARLVDLVTSDDPINDTPIYARAAVVRAHAGVLVELRTLAPAVKPPNPFDAIEKALAESMAPEPEPDDDAPDWDEVERRMAANPGTRPEPPEPGQVW